MQGTQAIPAHNPNPHNRRVAGGRALDNVRRGFLSADAVADRQQGSFLGRFAATRSRPQSRRPGRRPYRQLSVVGKWHARTYAARPTPGRFVAPALADVRVPTGYRPVGTRAKALCLFDLLPAITAGLREDSRATRWAIWRALADFLDETGVGVVGQERLAEWASGYAGRRVARATAGNHLRALEAAGVVVVAVRGASGVALGTDRDRAPAYVILAPDEQEPVPVDELGHLPEGSAPARAKEITHSRLTGTFPSSNPSSTTPVSPATTPQGVLGRLGEGSRPGPVQREHPERYAPRNP